MDAMAARQENAVCGEAPLPHVERETFSKHDDQWLIEQLQAGDTEAFEVLFKRYAARVSRQAMHLLDNEAEAEEVTQEVFLTLYEKAITFRGDAALGRLRHRKRHSEVSMDDYLPRFRDDGHHLVRPVVDWSSDLERGVASEELRRRGGEDISL
jgi:DNA-directed RNA polymerase specialized sigma24 family protein